MAIRRKAISLYKAISLCGGASVVKKIAWESQIGRRLKLRDLHVFVTVVQRGSMAKAAAHLGVSQPAVSEIVGDLEHALGVRLLDRLPQGVEPTMYGRALFRRCTIVFDELRQGIKDIAFLADPTVGEVQIGCPESIAASILPPVIRRFSQEHPGIVLQVQEMISPQLELPELRERHVDIVIDRLLNPGTRQSDELDIEVLFNDELVIAAGLQNRWANHSSVDLADLVDDPWILSPSRSWGDRFMADAFRARGLALPKVALTTFSVQLRINLLTAGPFIATFPKSVVADNPKRLGLKILPVDLTQRSWPVALITLKNRVLSPVALLFIDYLRAFARSNIRLEPEQKSA
jgi:DNA-binding transcriptional LysR family regulator